MRGERDDWNIRRLRIRFEATSRFPAVDERNRDVHQNESWMSRLRGVDARLSIPCLDDFEARMPEDRGVNHEIVLVVFNEEHGLILSGHETEEEGSRACWR